MPPILPRITDSRSGTRAERHQPQSRRRGSRRAGQRRGQPVEVVRAVRAGDEPGLERRGRQVDPGVQQRVEERRVRGHALPARGVVVAYLVRAEEHREQVAGALHPVRHAGIGQRGATNACTAAAVSVQVRVQRRVASGQRGQPGGHRHRVPRQRAGLVHRALRRQQGHHVGPAAERADRQPAADHLAEGEQVGCPTLAGRLRGPIARPGRPGTRSSPRRRSAARRRGARPAPAPR